MKKHSLNQLEIAASRKQLGNIKFFSRIHNYKDSLVNKKFENEIITVYLIEWNDNKHLCLGNLLESRNELLKYDSKYHTREIVCVNKIEGILGSNPRFGEREKIMIASNTLEGEANDWFL